MTPLVLTLIVTAIVLTISMVLLWIVATARRNAGVVDIFWGTGFAITSWIAVVLNQPAPPRVLLLAAMTTIWGLRLSFHLWRRNRDHEEDRRYAAMRKHHGRRFWWVSLFIVFLLQAGILWFVSLPLQVVAGRSWSAPLQALDLLGVVLFAIGLFFEAVGDRQLSRFRADPRNRGRVLDIGLWRYTRHPNYFGDFCVWWGLYLTAAAGGAGWTVGSPLAMSWLLMRVSGVTLLEQTIADRRPGYADYTKRTSAFFPGRPRS